MPRGLIAPFRKQNEWKMYKSRAASGRIRYDYTKYPSFFPANQETIGRIVQIEVCE